MSQITDLLAGQSPRIIDAIVRLVRRIVDRKHVDAAAIEAELDAVFAEVGADFGEAFARLEERFPEGTGEP